MPKTTPDRTLIERLARNREEILASWTDRVRGLTGSAYASLRPELLAGWGADLLEAIIESLKTGTDGPIERHTERLADRRLEQGFEIEEVISSILILRETCRPYLRGDAPGVVCENHLVHDSLDVHVRRMVSRFAARYSRGAQESLEGERRRMEVLLKIAEAASGAPDLAAVLQLTIDALAPVIGATECAAYAPDPDATGLRLCAMVPGPTRASKRLFSSNLPAGVALLDSAIEARQPVVRDAAEIPEACLRPEPELHGIGAIAVFPLVTQEGVQAVILAAIPSGPTEQLDLACGIANTVLPAVRSARLHEQHERMMVTEERQRLARELHDSVTQSLYGVTMYAEAAARLLDRGVTDEAGRILRELRDTSISALREMRLMIFELRPPSLAEDGLVTAIESRLGAVEARAGLRTEFEYDEIGHLPTAVEEALFGIAREALNNVLKHAGADGVVVRLRLTDAALRLEVVDDGVGFEVGDGRARGGLGLAGMEERSGMTGLKLDVASRPGAGTSVSVEVPRPWPDEN